MTNATNTASTTRSTATLFASRRTIQVMRFPEMPMLIIETRQFPTTFAEGDVQDLNQGFIDILEELRQDVQEKGVDLTGYKHDYLTRLRDTGKAAYNTVLPPAAREYIAELEEKELERNRGLSFTFKTPPTIPLFWEMFYAGEPFSVKSEQFWGFRYPLGRTFWEIEAPDRISIQKGVFSAIHRELECSKREVVQLAHQLKRVSQRLGRELSFQVLDEIPSEFLSLEQIIKLFHAEQFLYGVVHFACHCENLEDAGASQAYLCLTARKEEMMIVLEKLLTWQEYGFVNQPFVFLNACESATSTHLMQMLSFPTSILNFGAGGVIATACTMPDNFASAFATEFYRRLLKLSAEESEHGEAGDNEKAKHLTSLASNIGEALLDTRLHFLDKFNNPLGLAYGLYAVSNQELRLED